MQLWEFAEKDCGNIWRGGQAAVTLHSQTAETRGIAKYIDIMRQDKQRATLPLQGSSRGNESTSFRQPESEALHRLSGQSGAVPCGAGVAEAEDRQKKKRIYERYTSTTQSLILAQDER